MAMKNQRTAGLECRQCGCRHVHVVYTEQGSACIIRRRECRHCGTRGTTRERAVG